MKISDVIKVWDIIHFRSIGDLGFCDLEKAIDETVGVENDIAGCDRHPIKGDSTLPKAGSERDDG